MKKRVCVLVLLISAVLLCGTAASADPTYHRAVVRFDRAVQSDGEVNFTFESAGAEDITVTVKATKGVTRDIVADQLRRMLVEELDADHYEVKMNTEDQVLIKKRSDGAFFDINVGEQTISGLAVTIKKK